MEDGFGLVIRAGCDIKLGEEITHTYVDPLIPFLKRQELLNLGKFFSCVCPPCSDPSEFESYGADKVELI